MISLFYLLVFLLQKGAMPGLDGKLHSDLIKKLGQIRNYRKNQKTDDLCFENTKQLRAFKKEVFAYRFQDKPNYNRLREILLQLK